MEEHRSVPLALPNDELSDNEPEGGSSTDRPIGRDIEATGSTGPEQIQSSEAAVSMAGAVCEVREKPVRLVEKTPKHWEQRNDQFEPTCYGFFSRMRRPRDK